VRFALLTGDETPADLYELVTNLRERQRRSGIASVRDALNDDINEALGLAQECEAVDAMGSQSAV
jgi:hypothetical protein